MVSSRSRIRFQAFAETDDIVDLEPDIFIKLDHAGIRAADLKIDFRASDCPQIGFCFTHHAPGNSLALMLWMDGKIVDPTPMALVAGHHGGNDFISNAADQKKFRLHLEFAPDIAMRVVPWNDETAVRPQLDDSVFVRKHKWPDCQLHIVLAA